MSDSDWKQKAMQALDDLPDDWFGEEPPKIPEQCPKCLNIYRLILIPADEYSPQSLKCTYCNSTFLLDDD